MNDHLREQLKHLPIPEEHALVVGILMPDLSSLQFEIDTRPLELDEYAIRSIGDQWMPAFQKAWDDMEDPVTDRDVVHFMASAPNGVTFELVINAKQVALSFMDEAYFVFEETHRWMNQLWNNRNTKPTQESVDTIAEILDKRR